MEVENRIAELADAGNGIHTLPDKVARVKVCSDLGTDRFTKLEKALRVVNAEAGMKLKSNLVHAVSLCKCNKVFPVRNKNLVPLPFKNLAEILRPRANNPVGVLRFGAVAGTAGEGVDLMKSELFGKEDRITDSLVVSGGNFLVGMNGIAVTAQCADLHIIFINQCNKLVELRLIVKEGFRITV